MKKLIWTIATCFMLSSVASAQEIKDPLKNPYVWNKLKTTPSNEKLWAAYFGKSAFDMTASEGENYRKWKSYLSAQKTAEDEEQAYIVGQMRLGKINDDPEYTKLLGHIDRNFTLIEDYFEQSFKELGKTYTRYKFKHVSENYSKELWILEQENTIVELRKKDYIAKKKA